MELHHFQAFLAVAETLHFGRAAERLHVSQPTLSRQIQLLERELGVALFERSGRRVAITPAGRILVHHARRVADDVAEARRAVLELAGRLQGHLAVGSFDSASAYLIPDVLATLYARQPDLTISVATLGTRDALRAVREGELDAALVTLPVPPESLCVAPLFREELVVVLQPDHPLARRRRVPLVNLDGERLVTFRASQNTRRLIEQALAAAAAAPAAVLELESTEAIKDAVRAGLGVAILGTISTRGGTRRAGLQTRLLAPPVFREVGLVRRAGRPENALVAHLRRAIGEVIAELARAPTARGDGRLEPRAALEPATPEAGVASGSPAAAPRRTDAPDASVDAHFLLVGPRRRP